MVRLDLLAKAFTWHGTKEMGDIENMKIAMVRMRQQE